MNEAPQSWDRWPGEPGLWYDRFITFYLSQGPRRSIEQARRLYHADQIAAGKVAPNKRLGQGVGWHKYANKWEWKARAEAWDHNETLNRLAAIEADREANRAQRIETLKGLLHKAGQAVLILDPNEARWSDVTQAVKVAVQELGAEFGRAQAVDLEVTPQGPPVPTGAANAMQALEDGALDALIMALAQRGAMGLIADNRPGRIDAEAGE